MYTSPIKMAESLANIEISIINSDSIYIEYGDLLEVTSPTVDGEKEKILLRNKDGKMFSVSFSFFKTFFNF